MTDPNGYHVVKTFWFSWDELYLGTPLPDNYKAIGFVTSDSGGVTVLAQIWHRKEKNDAT